MDCAAVQPLLGPFLDGELDGSDRDAVALHLDHCADCGKRLNELRGLDDIWTSTSPPEPSERDWQRVARKLNQPEEGAGRRFPRRTWVAAAIIILLCASAGVAIARFSSNVEGFWKNIGQARDPVNLIDYLDGANGRQGRTIEPSDVRELSGLQPLNADELPGDFKLENCCIYCDGIVRYKFTRGESEAVVLLYQPTLTVVHGNKPLITFRLRGEALRIAQCKKRMSASWQATPTTSVSLITSSEFLEFNDLLRYIDRRIRSGK